MWCCSCIHNRKHEVKQIIRQPTIASHWAKIANHDTSLIVLGLPHNIIGTFRLNQILELSNFLNFPAPDSSISRFSSSINHFSSSLTITRIFFTSCALIIEEISDIFSTESTVVWPHCNSFCCFGFSGCQLFCFSLQISSHLKTRT